MGQIEDVKSKVMNRKKDRNYIELFEELHHEEKDKNKTAGSSSQSIKYLISELDHSYA